MHVHFKVHGQGRTLFGDGFALWYTKERMKKGLLSGFGHGNDGMFGKITNQERWKSEKFTKRVLQIF